MNNIYFLGPENSFSEIVAKKVTQENSFAFVQCETFTEIGEKILKDETSLGLLPIENSITSDIHENIDFLFKNHSNIVKEAYLNIKLNLIGLKGSKIENIKNIYSHPRAILQCTDFIKKHNFQIFETLSTSSAKNILLKNMSLYEASIGSREIVKNDDRFVVLEENIGNYKFNLTRFVFVGIGKKKERGNKASIIFKVLHKPGSLAKLLLELAKETLNITKIESRPIPGTHWEYHFWIDIESRQKNLANSLIDDIFKKNTLEYSILGIYQKGKIFES